MGNQVLTGAIALIKVNGVTVGKMKSLRINENYNRGSVVGIGELIRQEVPVLGHAGTVECDYYTINYETDGIPGSMNRSAQSIEEFVDNILLQEDGVQLVVFKKVTDLIDPSTGLAKSKPQVYLTINKLFLNREGMNVVESQIGGKTQSFDFLSPIIYPK